MSDETCLLCDNKSKHLNLCSSHYLAYRNANAEPCSVDGCGRAKYCKGLCNGHYQRLRKGEPIDTPLKNKRAADVEVYEPMDNPIKSQDNEEVVDVIMICRWCNNEIKPADKKNRLIRGDLTILYHSACMGHYEKTMKQIATLLDRP